MSIQPRWPVAALFALSLLATSAHAAKPVPVCGDGKIRGVEECDGVNLGGASCLSLGLGDGALACAADCTFDTSGCGAAAASCGDGVVDGAEECDGAADAACPGLCSAHCACPAVPPGDLELHVIDVGQGDAIAVVSPDGFVLLIDAGEEGQAAGVVAYLQSLGITELDYTLVSHFHADHVGGMDAVVDALPGPVACFDHGGSYSSLEYDEYVAAAGDRRTTLTAGQLIDMGPSLDLLVMHADTGSADENLNSVVVHVLHDGLAFLLGGDCEGSCEASLDPGLTEVYKVHHHGSSDASTDALLSQMDPFTALISVGAGNAYDHPAQDTLDRLTAHQASVYRTDVDGDLAVWSDGIRYTVNGDPVCTVGQTRGCGLTDVGACALGGYECVDGMWGATCVGAVYPVAEDCDNGVDDDCDGWDDVDDPDCAAGAAGVVIAQVGYDTVGDDATEEFVDLFNPTAAAVALDGWTLEDNYGSWTLPAGTVIEADGYLSVARDEAGFAALYGLVPDVSGLSLSLGNTGDQLYLTDGAADVDMVAWEGFVAGWTVAAPIGDSIERTDPYVDSDTDADFSVTSPSAPRGGTLAPEDDCGNGICDAGEDCSSCPDDCPGRLGGKPSLRFCCGNGVCEPVGEDAASCAIDCP